MKKVAIAAASLALPFLLAGCYSSTERVVTTPAPSVVEHRVIPETVTTTTRTVTPPTYAAPGGEITTTTRRDTVIETRP